jgi:hypothetical protein
LPARRFSHLDRHIAIQTARRMLFSIIRVQSSPAEAASSDLSGQTLFRPGVSFIFVPPVKKRDGLD